jgi:hypothetical protein
MGVNILSPATLPISSAKHPLHATVAIHSIGSIDALPTQFQYRGRQKQFAAFLQQQTSSMSAATSSSSSLSNTKPIAANLLTASTASGMIIRKTSSIQHSLTAPATENSNQEHKENIPNTIENASTAEPVKELSAREKYLQWKQSVLNKENQQPGSS